MQGLVVLALVLSASAAVHETSHSTFYDDNFDIDSFLGNTKLVENYINCMLDKRDNRCTREGKDLKHDLPRALKDACAECTPGQRNRMRKVCRTVKQKFPAKWELLIQKFDNDGRYKKSFDDFMARND